MDKQQVTTLVDDLYQAVDDKDIDYLDTALSVHCRFRMGNTPEVTDKALILEGNRQFFAGIKSMKHAIEEIVFEHTEVCGSTKICCYGTVKYERLDGSEHSAVFSTYLEIKNRLIIEYLVFADLSGL